MIRTWRFIASHPLASRNKTEAFRRWLRWQIGSRILGKPVVMPFVEDSVLVVEPGMTGATGNLYCGLHEFADMALVLHALRPGDLFVDVGANIGSYTVLAAKVAGAQCLALEPVPETFARLQRNLRINDIGSCVQAIQCAVGSGAGTLRFSADQDTTNRVVDQSYPGRTLDVPVESLDRLLAGRSPFLWKVDVEGFEREVLTGAVRSIHSPSLHAVLLEGEDAQIVSTMEAAGFTRGGYNPFSRQVSCTGQVEASNNHLWIRGLEEVSRRCREARRIAILGVPI